MPNIRNFAVQDGYVGADPVQRQAGDAKVVTFDLATTKRWKDKESGEQKEQTFWRRYEAWGQRGDNIMKLVRKGTHLEVWSEPSNNDYTDKESGEKVYRETHTVTDWKRLSETQDDGDSE